MEGEGLGKHTYSYWFLSDQSFHFPSISERLRASSLLCTYLEIVLVPIWVKMDDRSETSNRL
jgi:hypothetical protein